MTDLLFIIVLLACHVCALRIVRGLETDLEGMKDG